MKYDVFSAKWGHDIFKNKYAFSPEEDWAGLANRVVEAVCGERLTDTTKQAIKQAIYTRKFIPAGRYLYAAGREFHQVNNCFLFRAEDSREGWADLSQKALGSLMTGGGIGVDYSAVRPFGAPIKKTGGTATGPISNANIINENGRFVMQGGQRRSAIWGGLSWWHPDIFEHRNKEGDGHNGWLFMKNWSAALRIAKEADLTFALPMELTNISVIYDRMFFNLMDHEVEDHDFKAPWGQKLRLSRELAEQVWLLNCRQAFRTAEPGMSFNYKNPKDSLRNACTEVTSSDDSDKCNLGTVWLNRCENIEEFREICRLGVAFLLCGGIYSDTPNAKIRYVGDRNNRIGLGLGGFHEWLMLRGSKYSVTPELHEWLAAYRDESDAAATELSHFLGVNRPKGVRSLAPNGTIGIIAETTTSIEPLFCKAYKRRYHKDGSWKYQYVVDGSIERLVAAGVKLEDIEDAYDLTFEQRVKFQADVQDYVDMSISSTCNMPPWGSKDNNEGTVRKYAEILYGYAHRLRGFTVYPDGARSGQPLERVEDVKWAMEQAGQVFEETPTICSIGGICGG